MLAYKNFTFANVNNFAIKKTLECWSWVPYALEVFQMSEKYNTIHLNLSIVKPSGTVKYQKLYNYS